MGGGGGINRRLQRVKEGRGANYRELTANQPQ